MGTPRHRGRCRCPFAWFSSHTPALVRAISDTTYLATGDPVSDTLIVFMHTTGEASGVFSYYRMMYGWNPAFYAVSLDWPGDYGVPPILCPEATVNCKPHTEKPNPADCSGAYLELLKWAHGKVTGLMRGRSRLVLAGISFGGVLWEDYVRWRMRMGDPPIDGLILISNPTSDLWCSHQDGVSTSGVHDVGLPSANLFPVGLSTYVYGSVLGPINCDPVVEPRHGHNFGLGLNASAKMAEAEVAIAGAEARGTVWYEEAFDYQMVGNCYRDPEVLKIHSDVVGSSLPHIHWTDAENAMKLRLRKLIFYSRTTSAPECATEPEKCTSWWGLQDSLRATCTLASSNCTIAYVDVEPWRNGLASLNTYEETLNPAGVDNRSVSRLWGHWVHTAAPEEFRARLQAWL